MFGLIIICRAGGTRVALVTFGTNAELEFNLGDARVSTLEGTSKAIDDVRYSGGGTATAMALELVQKAVAPMARRGSHKALKVDHRRKIQHWWFPAEDRKSSPGNLWPRNLCRW